MGNMDKVRMVTMILYEDRKITLEELEHVCTMEDVRERTTFLIDSALGKGNGNSNAFLRTWEQCLYGRAYSSPPPLLTLNEW